MKYKIRVIFFWFVLPTILIGILAAGLGSAYMPTHVEVELSTNRLEFTVVDNNHKSISSFPLLNQVEVSSLQVSSFQHARLVPEILQDQAISSLKSFERTGMELFGVSNPQSDIQIETPCSISLGIKPGITIIITSNKELLQLKWSESQSLEILPTLPLRLQATHVHKHDGIRESDLRISVPKLKTTEPYLNIKTNKGGMLSLVNPHEKTLELLEGKTIPIMNIKFEQQDQNGRATSTLINEGKLTYVDYPSLAKQKIQPERLLRISTAESTPLQLSILNFDRDLGTLSLRISGYVNQLLSGREYRLTWLEGVLNNTLIISIFTIATWACSLFIGIYKLCKEI